MWQYYNSKIFINFTIVVYNFNKKIILQEMGQNIKEFIENWQYLELLMDSIAEICEVKIETWLWLSICRV
jgi:hypothetical protein